MGQYRNTGILAHEPYEKRRAMLARVVLECKGILKHVAFDLGYSRRHLYRLIDEHRVWAIVNRARIKRLEEEARERRRT